MGSSLSRLKALEIPIPSVLPRRRTVPVPPGPAVLLANPRDTYMPQQPKNTAADTPLATIYRIYWAIVMDDTVAMRNAIEYFWTRKEKSWMVSRIPRPPDSDPERFAIVSAIPYFLAAAFNRLIDLGLPRDARGAIYTSEQLEHLNARPKVFETVPQWAQDAPPLANPLRLPTKGLGFPETPGQTDPFLVEKNVFIHRLHVYIT